MEILLSRLERRFGRFAIPNLTMFVVGGMTLTFLLGFMRPGLQQAMALDMAAVRAGQVWRLVSYLFLVGTDNLLFVFFKLSFTWFIGRTLEAEWGAFKLNVYYLVGMIGTTLAATLAGEAVGNSYLNATLFFAFATLYPDYQISIFLIIPVRVKWIALLSALALLVSGVLGSWGDRAGLVAATSNYFLFFGGTLVDTVRGRIRARGSRQKLDDMTRGRSVSATAPEKGVERACTSCGKTEGEGADIRVCSCEKCGIPTLFCLEHAREHQKPPAESIN